MDLLDYRQERVRVDMFRGHDFVIVSLFLEVIPIVGMEAFALHEKPTHTYARLLIWCDM